MVFKSSLVTRLKSLSSWLPSNKHIYTQSFRKDNINSIAFILSKGTIPLLSPLSPWKNLNFLHFICRFSIYYIFFLISTVFSTLNSDWAPLTHSRTMTFWLSNTQKMTQFSFKLIVSGFHSTLKLQLSWNIKVYIPGLQHPLFNHDTWRRQTLVPPNNY